MPERLQPALARDQLDVVRLGTLEQVPQTRAERPGAAIHGPLADLLDREALVEFEDVLIRELDLHPAFLVRANPPVAAIIAQPRKRA